MLVILHVELPALSGSGWGILLAEKTVGTKEFWSGDYVPESGAAYKVDRRPEPAQDQVLLGALEKACFQQWTSFS